MTPEAITLPAITYDVLNTSIAYTNQLLTIVIVLFIPIVIVCLKGVVYKWFKL